MSIREQANILSLRDRIAPSEVAGYSVRCIASNIRTKDNIDWVHMLTREGIGYEGNILAARVETVDARKEMEHLAGEEITDIPPGKTPSNNRS